MSFVNLYYYVKIKNKYPFHHKFNKPNLKYEVYFITKECIMSQFRYVKNIRNDDVIKALGQRVRDLRSERKLTMEKLAELSGIDYRQLSYIELGQTDASLSTLYAISKGLDISLSFLMDSEYLR